MAKKRPALRRPETFIAFGDAHIPYHNPQAMEVVAKAIEYVRPDLAVCLGDLLDLNQFSFHPPTRGIPETDYEGDLEFANEWLDRVEQSCGRLVMVEGNHEYRLDRWAAHTAEGRGAYSMLAPRIQLAKGRKRFVYEAYGSRNGRYSHYSINSRIKAVHGWSTAKNAADMHLAKGQGKTIIFGHTHRVDSRGVKSLWYPGLSIQARSAGCLCELVPLWGRGQPVDWENAFILGFLGRSDDTMYTVKILDDHCVLPEFKKDIRA